MTTPAGNFTYYTCSSRRGKYDYEGNGDEDEAADGPYGSDRLTCVMGNRMNISTVQGLYDNISIKGGGHGHISATLWAENLMERRKRIVTYIL